MMTKSTLLIICSILTVSFFSSSTLNQTNQAKREGLAHRQWLQNIYLEATSIKEGMTRADLIKLFRIDGGLQRMLPERYVLNGTDMIKVDVKFDVPEDSKSIHVPEDLRYEFEGSPPSTRNKFQFVPNEKLKIKSISRPYIEPEALD